MQLISYDDNDAWNLKKDLHAGSDAENVSLNFVINRHFHNDVPNHEEKVRYLWSLGSKISWQRISGCVARRNGR
jgi:hypothetical protein